MVHCRRLPEGLQQSSVHCRPSPGMRRRRRCCEGHSAAKLLTKLPTASCVRAAAKVPTRPSGRQEGARRDGSVSQGLLGSEACTKRSKAHWAWQRCLATQRQTPSTPDRSTALCGLGPLGKAAKPTPPPSEGQSCSWGLRRPPKWRQV